MAATTSAAVPSSGRDRPAPNSASMMRSASASVAVPSGSTGSPQRLRHGGGIALEGVAAAEQAQAHPVSLLAQEPRGHEAVATVVAGPADDRDRGTRPRRKRGSGVGHGAAGILHQHETRHALRDGQRVGAAHLLRGEQLVARQGVSPSSAASCADAGAAPTFETVSANGAGKTTVLCIRLNIWANSRLALGACCPVDTHQSYAAWGFLPRRPWHAACLIPHIQDSKASIIEVGR